MPWCATCDRFLNPPSVNPDGSCPHCGQFVTPGHAHESAEYCGEVESGDAATLDLPGDERARIPWHLKALLGALAVYLGYRFFDALVWTFDRVFS